MFSLSSALAYSQAIAYQGVWLLFFLNLYRGDGGNNFSLDPSAADEAIVQQAMGSLVAAPKLIALVAGPAAVLCGYGRYHALLLGCPRSAQGRVQVKVP